MEIEELYCRLESRIEHDLKFLVVQKKDILKIEDAAILLNLSTSQVYKLNMMMKSNFTNLMVKSSISKDPILMNGFLEIRKLRKLNRHPSGETF